MGVAVLSDRHRGGRPYSGSLLAGGLILLLATISLLVVGCSCARSPGEGLEGIDWELQGSSASSIGFREFRMTARFEDGTVSGRAAVNGYTAKYEVGGGGSLRIGELTSTLIAGTPDAMRAEETYFTMLRAVRSWGVANGQLELRDGEGNPLLIYTEATRSDSTPIAPPEDATGAAEPSSPAVSDTSVAYARSIGGTPRRGDLLYVIVGASYSDEAAASAALNDALPLFGDMQTYFIVQRSESFAGLSSGRWVIVEAHRNAPDESSLELARRAFAEARVQRVTVRTDDPIPVYEDLVGR